MSRMDKIIELRKDFGLNNETKMVVMLSILMHDMNRNVAMYPEVWFIDCTAGKFFHGHIVQFLSYKFVLNIRTYYHS